MIRCRVTPVVKSQSGGTTVTGAPKWSDYVVIKKVTDPSDEFENILDVLGKTTPNGTGDVFLTDVSTSDNENSFDVVSGDILMKIKSPSDTNYGASFVMQLKYDKFDNDRIYGAWAAGRESASDIPSYMTVTNYSVVTDIEISNSATRLALFLSTRSNNPNFSSTNKSFEDLGYAIQYLPPKKNKPVDKGFLDKGFFVSKYKNGKEIEESNKSPYAFGIYNETELKYKNNKSTPHDYYYPETTNNSVFTFLQWQSRQRIIYTVLEYFVDETDETDETKVKAYPRYIFRVRFLKRTDNWDDELNPEDPLAIKLSEIKKRDPWCIGPKFYASEPMWFGDFVGNQNTTTASTTTTVKVKNYDSASGTATFGRSSSTLAKIFYAMKNSSSTAVFRKRALNVRTQELRWDGYPISGTDVNINNENNELGHNVLSRPWEPWESRYVGIKGAEENTTGEAVKIRELGFAPGFSINEIRSIMPKDGKLYGINETMTSDDLSQIAAKDWYKSYMRTTPVSGDIDDINKVVFGDQRKSAGTGDNGSWYYQNAGGDGGVYDLQHRNINDCKCPLHNELFKWLGGQ